MNFALNLVVGLTDNTGEVKDQLYPDRRKSTVCSAESSSGSSGGGDSCPPNSSGEAWSLANSFATAAPVAEPPSNPITVKTGRSPHDLPPEPPQLPAASASALDDKAGRDSKKRYVTLSTDMHSGGLHCLNFSVRLDISGLVDDILELVLAE